MNLTAARFLRISGDSAFRKLFRTGRKANGKLFTVWFTEMPLYKSRSVRNNEPALAVSIKKNYCASAVKRNLWKRRIKEAMRKLPMERFGGWSFLINVRARAVADFDEIKQDLENLFRSIQ